MSCTGLPSGSRNVANRANPSTSPTYRRRSRPAVSRSQRARVEVVDAEDDGAAAGAAPSHRRRATRNGRGPPRTRAHYAPSRRRGVETNASAVERHGARPCRGSSSRRGRGRAESGGPRVPVGFLRLELLCRWRTPSACRSARRSSSVVARGTTAGCWPPPWTVRFCSAPLGGRSPSAPLRDGGRPRTPRGPVRRPTGSPACPPRPSARRSPARTARR